MSDIQIKYRNPPAVETVCEVIFDKDLKEVMTAQSEVFAQISEALSGKFPNHKKIQGFGVFFDAEKKITQPILEDIEEFSSEDGKTLVRIDKNKLSIHQLKPYKKWEPYFFPCIQIALSSVLKSCSPSNIQRIGLRYINQLDVHDTGFKITKYFSTVSEPRLDDFGSEVGFQITSQRILDVSDNTHARLTVSENANPSILSSGDHKVIVDIDVFSTHSRDAQQQTVELWLGTAKKIANDLFEKTFSEDAKNLFK